MWLIDACVDVFLIHPNEHFLEDIVADEPRELWMRSLVVIVMTIAAFITQRLLIRQKQVELLLRDYQHHLEDKVAERTRDLEQAASLDPLTKIYNRRKFSQMLAYEIQRSKRYHQPLALLMCDLDYFKEINDAYGHQRGDEVLVEVADVFKTCLRKTDIYARWGGEEFIVLLLQTDLAEAKLVADNLRQQIAEIYIEKDMTLTASFGLTSLQEHEEHEEHEELEAFLKRADDALYQAKRSGRNKVVIDEPV